MRILVVDDDQVIVDLMRYWLEKNEHTVVEASDGRAALGQLNQADFDLLITDLAMPHVDGIELIQEVKKTSPTQKILAVSSKDKTGSGLLKAATTLGADGAIPKPLDESSLLSAVAALL